MHTLESRGTESPKRRLFIYLPSFAGGRAERASAFSRQGASTGAEPAK